MTQESKKMKQEALDEEPGLMMTPMVDIVFQLLIFFMLACRFRTTDGQLHAFLPKNRGMGTQGPAVINLNEVRIKLLWVYPGTTRETRDPAKGETILKVKDIVIKRVCATSGLRATSLCPEVIKEAFLKGTEPVEWCPLRHH